MIIGLGGAGLDPLPAIPAVPRRVRAAARPRALLHQAEVRRPRGHDPQARRHAAAAAPAAPTPLATARVPIEIRRFGVGNRRPGGPIGSVGLSGQVLHSDGRGNVSELAFARNARTEAHANPNMTLFIVVEGGGWVGVGDERARIAAGEAAVWPADIPHAAWTEHSEMRAIIVEFTGADDRDTVEGRARERDAPTRCPWPAAQDSSRHGPSDRSRPTRTRASRPDRRGSALVAQVRHPFEEVDEVVDLVGRPAGRRPRGRHRRCRAGRRHAAHPRCAGSPRSPRRRHRAAGSGRPPGSGRQGRRS